MAYKLPSQRQGPRAGITNGRVFRSADDPNEVVVLQDVTDVAKARTWLGSDETKAAMQKSGVAAHPASASQPDLAAAETNESRDGVA